MKSIIEIFYQENLCQLILNIHELKISNLKINIYLTILICIKKFLVN